MRQNSVLLTGFKNSSSTLLLDKVSKQYSKFLFTKN